MSAPTDMKTWLEITAYDRRVEAVVLTAYDTRTGLLFHSDVRW